MNIWLINHYAVPTKYYPLARPATFAKYLMRMGHTVTIFAASTVHNSDKNLIEDGSPYKEDTVDGIHYVYIKNCGYSGNGFRRIVNMLLFPIRLPRVCKQFDKPDAILATSVTPMACMKGINLAKKYRCKGVAEIADLWPETFVAYGAIKKNNPILKFMYMYERKLYTKADAIIFTMEGGKDYIIQKGWDNDNGGPVNLKKVYHINNGVDLEVFNYNKEHYTIDDNDLNSNNFKVVYTGSIRMANQVDKLVYIAKELENMGIKDISIIIWGAGNYVDNIQQLIDKYNLKNIKLKGYVEKKYIPFVLSKSDLNIYLIANSPLYQFGLSLNKSFEYFASGKPVLSNANQNYSLIERYECGVCVNENTPEAIAKEIKKIASMEKSKYREYCAGSLQVAKQYDFLKLTNDLMCIIESQ